MDKRIVVNGYVCEVRQPGGPKTSKYWECMEIFRKDSIQQISLEHAVRFILDYSKIPEEERKSILEFAAYEEERILEVRASKCQELFKARTDIAKAIGWYPYFTGTDLDRSPISDFVNSYVKHAERLELKKPATGQVTLFPISDASHSKSFLLRVGEANILLDAGLSKVGLDNLYSLTHPKDLDLVIISHSHYDRTSGILPLYLDGCDAYLAATAITIDLIVDTLNHERAKPILNHLLGMRYGERLEIGEDTNLTLLDAGHIPGSAMTLITTPDVRILYTGDFCLRKHEPLSGSANEITRLGRIDALILDSQHADSKFGPDADFYVNLRKECGDTFLAGKNILIAAEPAMAQNIFLTLHSYFSKEAKRYETKPMIYVEPKILEYMMIVRNRIEDLPRDFQSKIQKQRDPFSTVMRKTLSCPNDDEEALSKPSIIITYPDDLGYIGFRDRQIELRKDCVVARFLPTILGDRDNLLVLTGSAGREIANQLKTERMVNISGERIQVLCNIFGHKHPEASLFFHCDYPQLEYTLKKLGPQTVIPFPASNGVHIKRLVAKYEAEMNLPKTKTAIPLRSLADEQRIECLIKQGESGTLEFKSSLDWDYTKGGKSKEVGYGIAKTLCAFMNSNGGTLLIGVSDQGDVLGLEKDFSLLGKKQNEDGFQLKLTELVNTYLGRTNQEFINLRWEELQGKSIARVKVRRGKSETYLTSARQFLAILQFSC